MQAFSFGAAQGPTALDWMISCFIFAAIILILTFRLLFPASNASNLLFLMMRWNSMRRGHINKILHLYYIKIMAFLDLDQASVSFSSFHDTNCYECEIILTRPQSFYHSVYLLLVIHLFPLKRAPPPEICSSVGVKCRGFSALIDVIRAKSPDILTKVSQQAAQSWDRKHRLETGYKDKITSFRYNSIASYLQNHIIDMEGLFKCIQGFFNDS